MFSTKEAFQEFEKEFVSATNRCEEGLAALLREESTATAEATRMQSKPGAKLRTFGKAVSRKLSGSQLSLSAPKSHIIQNSESMQDQLLHNYLQNMVIKTSELLAHIEAMREAISDNTHYQALSFAKRSSEFSPTSKLIAAPYQEFIENVNQQLNALSDAMYAVQNHTTSKNLMESIKTLRTYIQDVKKDFSATASAVKFNAPAVVTLQDLHTAEAKAIAHRKNTAYSSTSSLSDSNLGKSGPPSPTRKNR